jgi:para-aminobenzoate synthetase component 1
VRIAKLDYAADSARRFGAIADRDWAVLLDSGSPRLAGSRYDIYAADPYVTLTTRDAITEITTRSGRTISERDPLALLREQLGDVVSADPALPFCGGAIGYFGYDLGRRYEQWPAIAEPDIDVPEMAIGLYDWAVIVDHDERRCRLVGQGRDEKTFDCWKELRADLSCDRARVDAPLDVLGAVSVNLDRDAYNGVFDRIKRHIREGDCYQVNLAQRFTAPVAGSSWSAYESLRAWNPAPYSAFLNLPFGQLLSTSPERFLEVRGRRVVTQPIKGTRPRGRDDSEDHALARELELSAKDLAENVMIVDLLRNDLGRNCAAGSVRATNLFEIQSFANVHHLVSTVEGRLACGRHAVDVLRDAFPGGSITGAPKLAAIEIIEECEPQRRNVYCGAIGYLGFDGAMDTNIAIRTLLRVGGSIHAWAGSGIVADSDPALEYQECFDKASGLLALLSGRRVDAAG